jgi:hypothetical protein
MGRENKKTPGGAGRLEINGFAGGRYLYGRRSTER